MSSIVHNFSLNELLDDVIEKSKSFAKKRIENQSNLKMRLYKIQKQKELAKNYLSTNTQIWIDLIIY